MQAIQLNTKHNASRWISWLWIALLLLALAVFPLQPTGSAVSAASLDWLDEFDPGALDPVWSWINEDPSMWSLTENPGFLRIYASPFGTGGQNLLLRPVAAGDFMIKTRLLFEPDTNFQFAGLVIYQDAENFLQLGRAFCDVPEACVGNGLYFDYVSGGGGVGSNFARSIDSPAEAYLRLERRGEMVRGYFSYEGITWFEIGTHWIPPDFQVNGVGLTASQDFNTPEQVIPADFDFFLLSEGGGFLPEGFHDYEQGDVPHWACNAGGWAVDPDDRETDLWVEITVDGVPLSDWALAGEYRPDLEESGGCVGGSCGFNAPLWDRLTPYEPHTVSAYAQDIPSGEWVLLSSSPKELTCRTYDIYVYDTLTRETRQITDLRDSWEFNPRWSPNGKQIVHDRWSLDFSSHAVHITDVASGISTPLVGAESGSYPAWSPNGQWIAFDREEEGVSNLYILPPDGGVPQLVRADAFMASWAPNSQRLVFNQPSDGSLRTIDLKDGHETLVVERGNGPAWSPNGQWIAYEVDGDIWKVNVDMHGNLLADPLRLTSESAWEGRPSWHNNSHSLAFHANLVQDTDIWSISAQGGEATWMTGAPGFDDYDANYSNNGRYVAYSSFSPGGQAARQWVAAFTYDLPPDSLPEAVYPYHFELEWSLPEPGSFSGQGGDFIISGAAPIYDGYVLLRGPFELRGVDTPEGLVCEEVGEINPSQPMRFLMGWLAEGEMTYSEALAHFESMTGRAVWGDGMSAKLVRHQVIPFSMDQWFQYVCTWTTRQTLSALILDASITPYSIFLPCVNDAS